ncbi:MAG: Ig-like domain-containing protein, partial [Nitrososphaerales archaeon]
MRKYAIVIAAALMLSSLMILQTNEAFATDTTPPTVAIASPSNGATVQGTILWTASATDNVGIKVVQFLIDGNAYTADSASPYSVGIATTALSNGAHRLLVVAYDTSMNSAMHEITIYVNNGDTTPPAAPKITNPASGTSTSDTTPTFSGTAEASSTIRLYDGSSTIPIATTTADSTGSWSATPSSTMTAGTHSVTAKCTDAAGNTSPASTAVSVTIDTTPPKVSIISPSIGAMVKGTITVSVSATDNVGVSKVELYLGGSLKGTDTTSPYSFSLDTSTVKNGYQTLMAKAFDKAGNTSTQSILIK